MPEEYSWFTLDDVEYLMNVLSTVDNSSVGKVVNYIDLSGIDLRELEGSLHGITDPIGQLKSWLYDRFNELVSWFASTVQTVFNTVYNSIIAPVLNAIQSAVNTIWNFLQNVPGQIGSFVDVLKSFVSSFWNSIQSNIITPFVNAISNLVNLVSSGINSITAFFTTTLPNLISQVPTALSNLASSIWSLIQNNIIKPLTDTFSNFINLVKSGITGIADFFTKTLPSLISQIPQAITNALSSVWNFIQNNVITPLSNAFSGLINIIQSGLNTVVDFFTKTLPEYISKIPDAIKGVITAIQGAIGNIIDYISKGLSNLVNFITTTVPQAFNNMLAFIQNIGSQVWNFIQNNIISPLTNAISNVFKFLQSGFNAVVDFFTKTLPGFISQIPQVIGNALSSVWNFIQNNIITPLSNAFSGFINLIQTGITSIVNFFTQTLPGYITEIGKLLYELPSKAWEALQVAGMTIFQFITKLGQDIATSFAKVGEILSNVAGALNQVGVYLTGFVNGVLQLPQRLYEVFSGFFNTISNVLQGIGNFFNTIYQGITSFISDPVGWLSKNVITPLIGGLQFIGQKLMEGLTWLWNIIRGGLQWVWDRLVDLGSWVLQALSGIFSGIIGILKSIGSALSSVASSLYGFFESLISVPSEIIRASSTLMQNIFSNVLRGLRLSSPPYLTIPNFLASINDAVYISTYLLLFQLLNQIIPRFFSWYLKGTGMALSYGMKDINIDLSPLGIGVRWRFSIGQALGGAFWTTADTLEKIIDKQLEYSVMGVYYSYGTYVSRYLAYSLRNYIPIELPAPGELVTVLRRASVAESIPPILGKDYNDIYEGAVYYLAVRGYSDFVIKMFTALEDEMYTTVKDRFGVTRKIPLSLMYVTPSPSNVVEMIIKDVVTPPQISSDELRNTIEKLFRISGMNRDLAALYFLTHFKYPSPTQLARFYWRAVAGLAWLNEALVEPDLLNAFGYGWASNAVSPYKLNFDAKTLTNAMKVYLRWLDYFPGAWVPGFTSDTSIIMELTADLPRRIDIRWMARWGLFEHLSSLGVSITSDPAGIIDAMAKATGRELLSPKVTTGISFDVTMIARLLEATGYHPYWIPVLSVAWIHQALSDELTLLRTGFLNAYKEGLVTLDLTEQLMSGLFIIQFKTGYIDPSTGKPVTFTYNKPVLWLPAERRLLQLRMTFDRYIDLTRDMMREIVNGVRRLALTKEKALEMFTGFFDSLSKAWSDDVKAISGVDWKPVLDERYIQLWLNYADSVREIERKIWVRTYTSRLAGWLMYRVAYGWLEEKDWEGFLNSMTGNGWLTDEEADFFRTVFKWISGVVKKEYMPTPLTLATFAEYMDINDDVINAVFGKYELKEPFTTLYLQYIKLKPIKSDYKSLLSTARRALRYGVIDDKTWSQYLANAKNYGFSDRELDIIQQIAELEVAIASRQDRIPTPSALATLAEYMVIDEKLVDISIKAYRLEEPFIDLYKKYIRVKPIKSDYKSLLTTARRALRYGVITEDVWKQYLANALNYGFTEIEVSIQQQIADLEVAMQESREYIPTPSTLATLAEYMTIPQELIQKVFQARRIPQEWQGIWLQYITIRPLADDVRALMTSYLRALRNGVTIPEDVDNQVKQYFSMVGITDTELKIRELAVTLDTMTETLPTLSQLVTMAEYIEVPIDYVQRILVARRVEKTYAQLWLQYISARTIASEVNTIVGTVRRIYEYFSLTPDMLKQIEDIMRSGGWTTREIQLFELDLSLRKQYRIFVYLIPSIRQFITDGEYLPNYEQLLVDVIVARGIEVDKYKAQVDYYRKLLKNRRLWRHFSWWRSRLMYAYGYGAISRDQVMQKLQKFKELGLVDDDEINMILDGLELYKAYRLASQTRTTTRTTH